MEKSDYKEKLSYNYVRKAKENLSKSIEWIEKIEKEKGKMLIHQSLKLADILERLYEISIEMYVLENYLS